LYHKLRKTCRMFYWRYPALIIKYRWSWKSLMQHGISKPVLYGDLIYKLKKIESCVNFSTLFVKSICKFKKVTVMIFYNALHAWWLTHLQLIIMLTSVVARRWQGFKSLWRFMGKSCQSTQKLDLFLLPHVIVFLLILPPAALVYSTALCMIGD
jgi:hypothetical protein